MAAFTTFLNLYLPGGGSSGTNTPDEVADIDRLNQNFSLLDDFASLSDSRLDKLELPNGTQLSRQSGYNTPTAEAPLPWDNSIFDAGDWSHSSGTFTCIRAGVYFVSFQISVPAGSATTTTISVKRNGTALSQGYVSRSTSEGKTLSVTALMNFAAGDTLSGSIVSSAPTGLDVTFNRTNISIFRVRST